MNVAGLQLSSDTKVFCFECPESTTQRMPATKPQNSRSKQKHVKRLPFHQPCSLCAASAYHAACICQEAHTGRALMNSLLLLLCIHWQAAHSDRNHPVIARNIVYAFSIPCLTSNTSSSDCTQQCTCVQYFLSDKQLHWSILVV